MTKRAVVEFISLFCMCIYIYSTDAYIRVNQLGDLPNAQKKILFISESPQTITTFSIHDTLTNKALETFNTVKSWGTFMANSLFLELSQAGYEFVGLYAYTDVTDRNKIKDSGKK